MKKVIVFLLVVAMVIASIAPAMAARKKPKKNFLFKGSVVSVGDDELKVEIEGGNRAAKKYKGDEVLFKVTDRTDIIIDGDDGDLDEIEEDDNVMIKTKGRSGDTVFKAQKIMVMGGGDDDGPGGPDDGKGPGRPGPGPGRPGPPPDGGYDPHPDPRA